MKQIMFQCFLAVKSKLDRKLGLFDLLGCDFLIDEEFKVRRFPFPLRRLQLPRAQFFVGTLKTCSQ